MGIQSMINISDKKNSIWICKQKSIIIGLETKKKALKQVLYHIENKKTKSIIFKNNKLYKQNSKDPLNNPEELENFIKRIH